MTPLITYLCATSGAQIAFSQVGNITQSAIALFVLSLFSVIGASFAASAVSREGEAFYLLKILPIPNRTMVASKYLFALGTVFISLLISALVLCLTGIVNISSAIIILFVCLAFAAGNIAFAMEMDIRQPHLKDAYEKSEKSTTVSMSVGFFGALLLGLVALLGEAFNQQALVNTILMAAALLYAVGLTLLLFRKVDKKIEKITI